MSVTDSKETESYSGQKEEQMMQRSVNNLPTLPHGVAQDVDWFGYSEEGAVEMTVIKCGTQTKLCLSPGLVLSL